MVKATVVAYCGNAPKMQQFKDLQVAWVEDDHLAGLAELHPDVRWEIVGELLLTGRQAVAAILAGWPEAIALAVTTMMSHGKLGAVNGMRTFADDRRL